MSLGPPLGIFGAPPSAGGVVITTSTPPAGTYSCCTVAANGNWIIGSTAVGLVTSTDKGATWGTPFNTQSFGPRCLFAHGNTILAVGASNVAQLSVAYSTDGGATWTGPLSVNAAPAAIANGQTRAACILGSAWWVCSGAFGGTLWKSTNNGVSWADQSGLLTSIDPWGIDTDGVANLLVTGEYTLTGTTSAWNSSTNSGGSFTLFQAGLHADTHDAAAVFGNQALDLAQVTAPTAGTQVCLADPYTTGSADAPYPQVVSTPITPRVFNSKVWAIGGKYAGGYASIGYTLDGGLTWKGLSPFTGQCTDLAFVSASELIAVGTNGPGRLVTVSGLS